MPIKMSRYVRIISSVTGAPAVAQQELLGRRFTTNPRVPIGEIVSVRPGGAEDYFGVGSPEAKFANEYFSYISPAPASQAKELQFAAWANQMRDANVFGSPVRTTLNQFKGVTSGSLIVLIAGVETEVTDLDLSGATSITQVAELITTAFTTSGVDVVVSYSPVDSSFSAFTPNQTGITLMKFETTALATMLGLSGAGAINSPGSAAQSLLEAFKAAEDITDSFGSASFPGRNLSLEEAIEVAEYVAAANVKYQMYWAVTADTADAWHAALQQTASNALILNTVATENKEALPMAVMAATEYTRTNSAINYMYRQPGVTWTPDVTDDQMADYYDLRRVNYFGQTANAGQKISFFQRGVLCGGVTAPLDMGVHANEQDMKAYLSAQLMSLHLTVSKIPANLDGRAMVLAIVQSGVDRGLNNGTVLPGKDLTELEKVAIIRGTNDPLAWLDVQTNGFWYDAQIVPETDSSGVTTYVAQYTLFYAKGDSVRRIEGSHNLI